MDLPHLRDNPLPPPYMKMRLRKDMTSRARKDIKFRANGSMRQRTRWKREGIVFLNEISDFITVEKTRFFSFLRRHGYTTINLIYVIKSPPEGYTCQNTSRRSGRGGGTAMFCRSSYKPNRFQTCEFETSLSLNRSARTFTYQIPSTASHAFIDHLVYFLEEISLDNKTLMIAGDFNIHVDSLSDPSANQCLNI